MFGRKLTNEQLVFHKKAMDDCESIVIQLYALVKFLAESKADPGRFKKLSEAIETVASLKRELGYDVERTTS